MKRLKSAGVAVALVPVIASIVAPTPAAAASGSGGAGGPGSD